MRLGKHYSVIIQLSNKRIDVGVPLKGSSPAVANLDGIWRENDEWGDDQR